MASARRTLPALFVAVSAAAALTGCAAPAVPTEGLSIVASTNVYGDIAASIAGDLATVTSIIDSAAQDPHSYEASAQDQLAIANADIVIKNGGGYDPFVDILVDGSGTAAIVVNAARAAGLDIDDDHSDEQGGEGDSDDEGDDGHGHIEGVNEHVWYDLHAVLDIAAEIAAALSTVDPANAATYAANLEAFQSEVESVEERAHALSEELGGGTVAVTEPVPSYLLAELGFTDKTPADFVEAIEEGADVPPLALQQTLELIASGEVRLLAYNEQTASPETERVRASAEAAGIPVVSFTETLPEGQDYVSWMRANIEAVAAALTAP